MNLYDKNSRKFSLFGKTPLFFSVVRVLRVLENATAKLGSSIWINLQIFHRFEHFWCPPYLGRYADPSNEPGIWEHLLVEFFRFFRFCGFRQALLDLHFPAQEVVSQEISDGFIDSRTTQNPGSFYQSTLYALIVGSGSDSSSSASIQCVESERSRKVLEDFPGSQQKQTRFLASP